MSIFKRVGLVNLKANSLKTAKKTAVFLNAFTANASVSEAGADEKSYPGKIKEHRFLTSKNLWADLSKFLSEI